MLAAPKATYTNNQYELHIPEREIYETEKTRERMWGLPSTPVPHPWFDLFWNLAIWLLKNIPHATSMTS